MYVQMMFVNCSASAELAMSLSSIRGSVRRLPLLAVVHVNSDYRLPMQPHRNEV